MKLLFEADKGILPRLPSTNWRHLTYDTWGHSSSTGCLKAADPNWWSVFFHLPVQNTAGFFRGQLSPSWNRWGNILLQAPDCACFVSDCKGRLQCWHKLEAWWWLGFLRCVIAVSLLQSLFSSLEIWICSREVLLFLWLLEMGSSLGWNQVVFLKSYTRVEGERTFCRTQELCWFSGNLSGTCCSPK